MTEKMGTASDFEERISLKNGDCLRFRRLSPALSVTSPRNRLAVAIFKRVLFPRSGQ